MIDKKLIALEAKKELARREFFYFCNLLYPKDYREDRPFLIDLCNDMQEFINSDDDIAIYNLPPRHYKSRTATMFVPWLMGTNIKLKIMTGSYNETLSTTFSKAVRNMIMEEKADINRIVYSDIFPETRIQKGDGAMNLWSLVGGYNNYLATSPTGTATGFGCNIMIIDDLIKLAEEANNENVLEKHWEWFTNTMLSRLEEKGKIIIIMTRWATGDLAGRIQAWAEEEHRKVRIFIRKAMQDNGTMLCPDILSYDSYQMKISAMGEDIASANYQQIPIDIKGKLYSRFKTYTDIPRDSEKQPLFNGIYSYCDVADEGEDFLCNIVWGEYNQEAYVLDIVFTKEPIEITEDKVTESIHINKVNTARFESQAGGKAFARNIERKLREEKHSNYTDVTWFHQTKNKISRILTNAPWVMNHCYFPVNWRDRWPDYYKAMNNFQREGKNAHDDAPDATTGIAETMYKIYGE